jgi:hypothetical protein
MKTIHDLKMYLSDKNCIYYRKRLEVAPYIERVIPILAHGAKPKLGP